MAAVDAGGQVVWQGSYDPYGRLLASTTAPTAPIEVPMRFAGQWYDRDAGLVYNHNRWYDSRVGRYLRPDPLFEQGQWQDPYLYVQGNPYTFSDPMGLWTAGTGVSFTAGKAVGGVTFSIMFVFDGSGNIGVAVGGGGGFFGTLPAGSSDASVAATFQFSDAATIDGLSGWAVVAGQTMLGAGYEFFGSSDRKVSGLNIMIPFKKPSKPSAETHMFAEYTAVESFNLHNLLEKSGTFLGSGLYNLLHGELLCE